MMITSTDGVRLAELLEQVHPVAVGQVQVGDDEVGRLLLLLLARLVAAADGQDGDFLLLQGGDQRAADDRVVLHHHDLFKSRGFQ